ncbi:MAG: glutamine amidotransferase family protein [Endomicrobia bacterium]|nr:glutamine amidotransferase family protein [Endomicrobiia bacterium]
MYKRQPSGCGIIGIMSTKGNLIEGTKIVSGICNMKERGNGLGSGFAGYGIYPEFKDYYCFHIMYQSDNVIEDVEDLLKKNFEIIEKQTIPTKNVKTLKFIPLLFRYFLKVKEEKIQNNILNIYSNKNIISEEELIIEVVMYINKNIDNAYVFSSGKNMGIFKGVGDPDDIAEFYRIDEYKGYIWTAHNRFPTNSVAWWGGAHPFGLLNWSVVHNGEISSYGINKRYLENFGYYCTLFTDTEVLTYLVDLLVRRQGLTFETFAKIVSSPFWSQIDRMSDEEKNFYTKLRCIYASALVNGPFAIIIATNDVMVGINDRTKLRPLVAAKKDEFVFIASEEASIRSISKNLDELWMPKAGEPVIVKLQM